MNQAYCIKCKSKKYMLKEEPATFKNGTPAIKGKCVTCDSTLYLIVSKQKVNA